MQPAAGSARPGGTIGRLVRELGAFGVVGGLCFVLDVGLFQVLYDLVGLDAVLAKLGATLVSMTAAYAGHRYWSFAHRARPGVRREYVRFALINAATLGFGLVVVGLVRHGLDQQSTLVLQAANVGAILVGTLVRFAGYRRWVFPARPPEVTDPSSPTAVVTPTVR